MKTLEQIAQEAWWGATGPNSKQDWQAVVKAVIAEHEARQWRPIAEAPKGGKPILVRGGECGLIPRVVWWHDGVPGIPTGYWVLVGASDQRYLPDAFAEFRQLPAPPEGC